MNSEETPRTLRGQGARGWPERVLMLVTDRRCCGERSLCDVVDAAIAGGVNVVQLREKDLSAGELLEMARRLRGVCGHRARLLVNDRVDVALLAGADGVQLGEAALPVAAVRRLLPATMRVGRSVHSVNAARQAEQDGADFLVLGTIFATPSHPESDLGGVQRVGEVTARVERPVLAIGGMTPERAAACVEAGAVGVAVVSGIMAAEDPQAAARAFAMALGLGE